MDISCPPNLCAMRAPPSVPVYIIQRHRYATPHRSPYNTDTLHTHQASLPQPAFLVCLSSLASLFLRPHFFLICSSSFSLSALISGATQHKLTKNCEHSNFSASRTLVHIRGSSARSRRISSICSWVRWYFFSYCGRTGANLLAGRCSEVGVEGAKEWRFRLGSLLGRNFCGVW